jgi:hypothetical protein
VHISYINNRIRSLEIMDSRTATGLIEPNNKITMKSVLLWISSGRVVSVLKTSRIISTRCTTANLFVPVTDRFTLPLFCRYYWTVHDIHVRVMYCFRKSSTEFKYLATSITKNCSCETKTWRCPASATKQMRTYRSSLQDGKDRLSRNVAKKLLLLAA